MTTLVKTGVLKRPHMGLRRGTESEGEQRKNTLDLLKVCSQEKESGKQGEAGEELRKEMVKSSFILISQRVLEHEIDFTWRYEAAMLLSNWMWAKHWIGCDLLYQMTPHSAKHDALEKGVAVSGWKPVLRELCGSFAHEWDPAGQQQSFQTDFPPAPVTEGTQLKPPKQQGFASQTYKSKHKV